MMSTLRQLFESGLSYSSKWGIWAYVDPQRGLRPEAPARIGQTQFKHGGVVDNFTMIVNGEMLGDMIQKEENEFRAAYEREHNVNINDDDTDYTATPEYEWAWQEFYRSNVVDFLIEGINNIVSYELALQADFELAIAQAQAQNKEDVAEIPPEK
jgi:hypothetical protein